METNMRTARILVYMQLDTHRKRMSMHVKRHKRNLQFKKYRVSDVHFKVEKVSDFYTSQIYRQIQFQAVH